MIEIKRTTEAGDNGTRIYWKVPGIKNLTAMKAGRDYQWCLVDNRGEQRRCFYFKTAKEAKAELRAQAILGHPTNP